MAKIGRASKPVSLGKASNFTQLSASMYKATLHTFEVVANAGASNFTQGFYSSNWMNDFLHSAGLITDQCYQDNRFFGDLFAGTTLAGDIVGSLLGGGALAPTLRSKTEQNTTIEKGGDDSEMGGLVASLNASALASAIQELNADLG